MLKYGIGDNKLVGKHNADEIAKICFKYWPAKWETNPEVLLNKNNLILSPSPTSIFPRFIIGFGLAQMG